MQRLHGILAVAAAAMLLGAGGAYAVTSSDGGVITACIHKHTHLLYAGRCRRGDRKLTWDQLGPRGATGPAGGPGARGQTGPSGCSGSASDPGAAPGNLCIFETVNVSTEQLAACSVVTANCTPTIGTDGSLEYGVFLSARNSTVGVWYDTGTWAVTGD